MKKLLLGSFVGAIILFVWSAVSWVALPVNLHTLMYTPAQDTLLKVLADNHVPSGTYAMPIADNRTAGWFDAKFKDDAQKVMKEKAGAPTATIFYKQEDTNMNATTYLRGFLFNFLAVLAASILLVPGFAADSSFLGRWWLTLVLGLLISASGPMIEYNWMGHPWNYAKHLMVDDFLNWGIVGLWLAYYFKKE